MKLKKYCSVLMLLLIAIFVPAFAQNAYIRTSTNNNHWVDSGSKAGTTWATTTNYLEVFPSTTYQTIQGFGGCFSEMAWGAIQSLTTEAAKDSVIRALFDTSGCNYTFCRMPIGSNDFADSYYSLDDVSNDTSMSKFSLHRDSSKLIPFIRAAQAYKPNLRFWASPWTPPSWMKKNNNYYNSSTSSDNSMKSDATTLTAYALYLSKAVQEFKKAGINIEYITCQNEPDQTDHNYPTCGWSNSLELNFYKNYMIPRFAKDSLTTKIILGVYCCTSYADWITYFMNDATVKASVGVTSHSWQDYSFGTQATSDYPTIPFFETEADWGQDSAHNWAEGVNQFNSMVNFLTTGKASVFTQWGMVLDQNYATNWGFKQSGPININTNTHVITYEPHYWAIKHIEHFIQVGAKIVNITSNGANPGREIAAVNPNGDVIVCVSNTTSSAFQATIKVGTTMYKATLPANSFNTIKIASTTSARPETTQKNAGKSVLPNARISNSNLYFTVSNTAGVREMDIALTDLQGRTVWTGHRAGSEMHGNEQSFAIRPAHGNLCSGAYLLIAKIRNETGTAVEKKIVLTN